MLVLVIRTSWWGSGHRDDEGVARRPPAMGFARTTVAVREAALDVAG